MKGMVFEVDLRKQLLAWETADLQHASEAGCYFVFLQNNHVEVFHRCQHKRLTLVGTYTPKKHLPKDARFCRIDGQEMLVLWCTIKRKLRRQFGTTRELFPSYLHEFMFRNRFRDDDMFRVMLRAIAANYPL
ncbi:hypothetical protein ACOMHN_052516 [Nucella lapillus]